MIYNMRTAKYDIALITLQNTNTKHRTTLQCYETVQYNTTQNSIVINNNKHYNVTK